MIGEYVDMYLPGTSFGTLARDTTMAAPAALVTANNHSAPITAAQRIILVKRKQAENKRQSIKEAALFMHKLLLFRKYMIFRIV